jgi:pimeloyl-ACP methyl ester carboxylesterase
MSLKPTLLFVHGAWHTPECWARVIPLVEAQHYKCVSVRLPSVNSNPPKRLEDDIQAVRTAIQSETSQGNDVVLVVHSYGGAVSSSALKGLMQSKQDESESSKNSSGRVLGMVMLASFFVPTGCTFLASIGGEFPPWWKPNPTTGLADVTVDRAELFYNTDLSPEDANYWAMKTGTNSAAAFLESGEHMYAGWMDVPVWFLACTEDLALPVEIQRMLIQGAKDAGANVVSREIKSSHCVMVSRPREVSEFIIEALAAFT